jgi:hypothetical protein
MTMQNKAALSGALAVLATAPGCFHEAVVYDSGDEMAMSSSAPATPPVSSYPIPPAEPKGTAYVMSLGPERLDAGPGKPSMYLHVRVAVENTADPTPWRVDPNDESISFGGPEQIPPAFAESSTGGPVLTAAKGARGHIDLYYPLASGAVPPRVTLSWRVQRGPDSVAQTTAFEQTVERTRGYTYYRPYGPEVRTAVGVDWWWWPYGYYGLWGPSWALGWGWGGWGWGSPYYWGGYRGWYGGHGGYFSPRYGGGRGYVSPGYGRGGSWGGGGRSAPSAPAIPQSSGKSGWRYRH